MWSKIHVIRPSNCLNPWVHMIGYFGAPGTALCRLNVHYVCWRWNCIGYSPICQSSFKWQHATTPIIVMLFCLRFHWLGSITSNITLWLFIICNDVLVYTNYAWQFFVLNQSFLELLFSERPWLPHLRRSSLILTKLQSNHLVGELTDVP